MLMVSVAVEAPTGKVKLLPLGPRVKSVGKTAVPPRVNGTVRPIEVEPVRAAVKVTMAPLVSEMTEAEAVTVRTGKVGGSGPPGWGGAGWCGVPVGPSAATNRPPW